MDHTRHCVRPGCNSPTAAILTYDYENRVVWLDDITGDAAPNAWGMCGTHADSLGVPRGWMCSDRRGPALALFTARAV